MAKGSKYSALDAFFISLGGQAPFVSFFTYGGYVISLLGASSGFAVLVATAIVLINGLVLYSLSRRFPYSGGYYIYSHYVLTSSLSFQTAWSYLFFNLTYGVAYLVGTAYMLSQYVVRDDLSALAIAVTAALFIYFLGAKPTARYAIFAGSLEYGIMTFIGFYLLHLSHYSLYNPIYFPHTFLSGILFATGIPTGFMTLASIAGDVENASKVVGKIMVMVILIGGTLASFDLYSLYASGLTLTQALRASLGLSVYPVVIFTAVNDGILGGLAYMQSTSSLLRTMSSTGTAPAFMSKAMGRFSASDLVAAILFAALAFALLLAFRSAYGAFVATGFLGTVSNLFINVAAGGSLLRISIRRRSKGRRYIGEAILAVTAMVSSLMVLVVSIAQGAPILAYTFFTWIIVGFVVSEILEISRQT
jgi:amino acid transporter